MTDQLTIVNRSVDPLVGLVRAQRSAPAALVAFLFGVAGLEELPSVVLGELLGEFDVSPAAARQQLRRMRADGQLDSRRTGRGVAYRLTGPFAATSTRLSTQVAGAAPPPWEGQFHALLYQIPEPQRAYRDRLRRLALLVGYGIMQPGVLIAVQDRADQLADVLADCPTDGHVRRARIGMQTAEAAQVALAAWELPEVAQTFGGHIDTLRAALANQANPPPTATTLRQLGQLLNGPFLDLINDPDLPTELCPADWPGHQLRAAIAQAQRHFLPPASQYIHQRLAATTRPAHHKVRRNRRGSGVPRPARGLPD